MPAHRMSMRKLKEILRLKWACGLSHRQISRAVGISVGAISAYAARASAAKLDWPAVEPLADDELEARLNLSADEAAPARRIEPDYAAMHRELRRKGVTLQLLWEEYGAAHPGCRTYRYTQFCQRYKNWAQTLKRSMRQQHRAGEKLFADFAGHTMPILGRDGGIDFQAHIFVAVLGASNYTYACATRSEAMPDWIGGLIDALEFYGGVPELLVPDNPKALIAKADRYEPVLGNTTQDFVNHYATAMLPARPRKPQDKAKVEVAVQIVERWILARLRNHRFFSLAELNRVIAQLVGDLNQRPFKKLEGNRREWFERLDRPVLRPLPARRYQIAAFIKCRVNIDYHVEIDHHYYSVPHKLVRQEVDVRVTRHSVEILHGGKRVAAHARSRLKGKHTTVAEHMPAAHRAHLEWSPGRLLNWGASIGPGAAAIVNHLLTNRPHPEMGYRACLGLLSLARKYGNERLEAACQRALVIGSPTRRSVLSILESGLDRQPPVAAPLTEWQCLDHENLRGSDYYH
ncbi:MULTISPECIES: IS21 family transposase [Pseudomonadota]|uniref:IS21 family transposase n=1 Tax=Pseudomonadota TaxID=1224 RepID=UPI0004F59425|nr:MULTISPECIES: IS21 family transposase [Pseudomonadota]AIO71740.1 integrase core domain protein [Burkholderia multivorans]AIO71893.1 integrase core domain protein [Burkholderia multivorans]AIO75386.1 integrase core domain protein [Burkholderia multivorans]AIO77162.1 integrase core domain protein [Burkholderia multivorans]MBJ9658893.1 IS21 family transposase [Burkholderia multivorans]